MSEEEKKELQPAAGGEQPSVSKESNAEDTSVEVDRDEKKPKSGEDANAGQDKPESADPDEEIDESNAEDAEDSENERRHHIPGLPLPYHGKSGWRITKAVAH